MGFPCVSRFSFPSLSDKIKQGKEESGIVIESYEPGIILLKLNSGYNIGILEKSVVKVEKLKVPSPTCKVT